MRSENPRRARTLPLDLARFGLARPRFRELLHVRERIWGRGRFCQGNHQIRAAVNNDADDAQTPRVPHSVARVHRQYYPNGLLRLDSLQLALYGPVLVTGVMWSRKSTTEQK